jgi:hypothetical protein
VCVYESTKKPAITIAYSLHPQERQEERGGRLDECVGGSRRGSLDIPTILAANEREESRSEGRVKCEMGSKQKGEMLK